MASWKLIEEIVKYCPTTLRVTDDGYRPLNGPIAQGNWDYHVAGQAVDFAGSASDMRDAAKWWMQFSPYITELIHTTPYNTDNGFYVKNRQVVGEYYYGSAVNSAHLNHVHVAIQDGHADALLKALKAKYGPPGSPVQPADPTPVPISPNLTPDELAWNAGWNAAFNSAFNIGFNAAYRAKSG